MPEDTAKQAAKPVVAAPPVAVATPAAAPAFAPAKIDAAPAPKTTPVLKPVADAPKPAAAAAKPVAQPAKPAPVATPKAVPPAAAKAVAPKAAAPKAVTSAAPKAPPALKAAAESAPKPVAPAKAVAPKPAKLAATRSTKPAAKPVATKAAAPAERVAVRKPAAEVLVAPKLKETKMENTIKAVADKAQDQAKTIFAEANTRAKGAIEKGSKMVEEINTFTKGNVEAVVESTKIYAKGVEAIGQDAAAFAKKQYEDATAAFKSFQAAKSPTEFFKLQSDFARAQFDALVAHGSKSTEKMIKLAGEVAQPLSNRVALAAEKIKVAA